VRPYVGAESLPGQSSSALASALEPLEPHPLCLVPHLPKAPGVAVYAHVYKTKWG